MLLNVNRLKIDTRLEASEGPSVEKERTDAPSCKMSSAALPETGDRRRKSSSLDSLPGRERRPSLDSLDGKKEGSQRRISTKGATTGGLGDCLLYTSPSPRDRG